MSALKLKFEGGKELVKALEQLPERVSRKFQREALTFAAEKHLVPAIERNASAHGHHPRVIIRRANVGAPAVGINIGPSGEKPQIYGFQEFGTSKQAAEPFMRPAFDTQNDAIIETVGRDLWVSLAGKGIHRMATAESGLGGGLV